MISFIVAFCLQVALVEEPSQVSRFFEALKVSVVSDTLPPFPYLPIIDPRRKPDELMREFATKNGKSLEKVDSLFVLRDVKPSSNKAGDAPEMSIKGFRRSPATAIGDLPTPAQNVSLDAPNVSLERLTEILRKEAHWDIQVAPALRPRRLFVHVTQMSVGDLLQGVGRLAYAGPRVLLETTAVQKAMLADADDSTPEKWKRRMHASDALREELEKMLTPEQKERNLKGEYIRIGLSEMPPELRSKALDYIKFAVGLSEAFGTELDLTQISQFGVRFRPPTNSLSWRELGVHVVGTDGYECYL